MFSKISLNLNLIVFVIFLLDESQTSKLNVPRVLMPVIKGGSATFTLEGTSPSACYEWTVNREDLIELEFIDIDEDFQCSRKVIIRSKAKELARDTAVVLADDVQSRQVLRCDIIIDVIHSYMISTTTRELFMEEAPETFEVRAYDIQGNSFTTLEGVEFDWQISCPSRDETVIRFMPFKDSPYEAPPSIAIMEEQNKKGYMVLLEGISTGTAKVSVRLPYKEYIEMKPSEVRLNVIANLFLVPSEVYLMVGDQAQFKVMQISHGVLEEMKLPTSQYYFQIESVTTASVSNKGVVTGLHKGQTTLVLYDKHIETQDVNLKFPFAYISVVPPSYMALTVLPYRNWAILLAEDHDIVAEVFTSDNKRISLGPNTEVSLQVDTLFHVQQRSKNGSWLTGWAIKEGAGLVQGKLKRVGGNKVSRTIASTAELVVYPRIELYPTEVIFPWDPVLKPKFEITLHVSGGDGKFLWTSSNHSVGAVSQTGFVRTYSNGYFEVSAAMQKNHNNRQTTKIYVVPPMRLVIAEFIMESEIGVPIYLHIALYADVPFQTGEVTSQVPVTHCQDFQFNVKVSNKKFILNETDIIPPVGDSCANVAVIGLDVGTTKVTISYDREGVPMEDTVTITAFKPLTLVHPPNDTVLAVGSSVQFIFSGGPKPSTINPTQHNKTIIVNNTNILQAVDVSKTVTLPDIDYTIVNVVCRKLGNTTLTLAIANLPTVPNCKYHESVITVVVICGKPRTMHLQPAIMVEDVNQCPMDLSAERVVVHSTRDIEIDVKVADDEARPFLDVSSLLFSWNLFPKELGRAHHTNGVYLRNLTEGGIIYTEGNFQVITPLVKTGEIQLSTEIIKYRPDILSKNKVTAEHPEFLTEEEKKDKLKLAPIVATIKLILVDRTLIVPSNIEIYNHPANKKLLSVRQGSGYFQLELSNNDVALVKYIEVTKEIEVIPKRDGELEIKVIDLCLPSDPALVKIKVVSVAIIRVEMSDKVEIGRCISCTVRFYDESDNLLTLPDISEIDLKTHLTKDIVKLKRLKIDDEEPGKVGEAHYIISGMEVQNTKLAFSVKSGSDTITSAPIDLQVFPPLKIFPRNSTLLVGSVLQLSHKGGPYPDATIEYKVLEPKITSINEAGLAKGLSIGDTEIHARSVGINPTTGQKIIYSEDQVTLSVIPLVGVKISAPLTKFVMGTVVPVWVSGVPEKISPVILGSVDPPCRFEWSVDNSDVVQISGIFEAFGIIQKLADSISIRLRGLKPGKTTLYLNAIINGAAINKPKIPSVVFCSKLDIEVFEPLRLRYPQETQGYPVLMAPFSSIVLVTNMDNIMEISYSVATAKDPIERKEEKERALTIPQPLVSVSNTGVVTSYGFLGRAMIVIRATDTDGLTQYLTISIQVKPIHYMKVNIASKWTIDPDSLVRTLPLGAEFDLYVSYHDGIGAEFAAGSLQLQIRNSRFDLVKVTSKTNYSMHISTKKTGSSVMKVWGEGFQRTADYVALHVEQNIKPPLENVVVGDLICLYTPLLSTEPRRKIGWSTSDKCVTILSSKKGIIRVAAMHTSQACISHTLHEGMPLRITIEPPSAIKTLEDSNMAVTNVPSHDPYSIPIVIINSKIPDRKVNLLYGWDCRKELTRLDFVYPYGCYLEFSNKSITIDPREILDIRPDFDAEKGQYLCTIFPGKMITPNVSTLSTSLLVWMHINGSEIKSKTIELPFYPGIYVDNEIIVKEKYFAILTITGLEEILEHVKVEAIHPSILYVYLTEFKPDTLIYTVKLLDYHWKFEELKEPMTVMVYSPLTSQEIRVLVTVDLSIRPTCVTESPGLLLSLYRNYNIGVIVLSLLALFFITFYAYSNYMQPVINVNLSRRSLLAEKSVSPDLSQGKAAGVIGHSPSRLSPTFSPGAIGLDRLPCSPTCTAAVCRRNRSFHRDYRGEGVYGEPGSPYSSELRRTKRFI